MTRDCFSVKTIRDYITIRSMIILYHKRIPCMRLYHFQFILNDCVLVLLHFCNWNVYKCNNLIFLLWLKIYFTSFARWWKREFLSDDILNPRGYIKMFQILRHARKKSLQFQGEESECEERINQIVHVKHVI
jgi:hypothetical protein